MTVFDQHEGAGWLIRRWRRRDYPQIDQIFRDCLRAFPWRGSPAHEVKRLRQTLLSADVLVAEEDRAGLVGFLSVDPVKAYVPHLFVAPDWRLCGVASGLLQQAQSLCAQPLQLDVDALNEAAMTFYRHLGWQIRAPVDQRPGIIRRGQIRLTVPKRPHRDGETPADRG